MDFWQETPPPPTLFSRSQAMVEVDLYTIGSALLKLHEDHSIPLGVKSLSHHWRYL